MENAAKKGTILVQVRVRIYSWRMGLATSIQEPTFPQSQWSQHISFSQPIFSHCLSPGWSRSVTHFREVIESCCPFSSIESNNFKFKWGLTLLWSIYAPIIPSGIYPSTGMGPTQGQRKTAAGCGYVRYNISHTHGLLPFWPRSSVGGAAVI